MMKMAQSACYRVCLCPFLLLVLTAFSCSGTATPVQDGESDAAPDPADEPADVSADADAEEELPPPETWILRILGDSGWGYGRFFTKTSDGGIAIAGIIRGTGFGETDVWVIRLDVEAELVWHKVIGGEKMEWMADIRQTQDGGFVLAGWTESFDRRGDGWIVRLDVGGGIAWQKTLESGSSERLDSVHETAEGNLVVGGAAGGNLYLAFLGGGGSMLWQKGYEAQRPCTICRLDVCENSEIILACRAGQDGFELARLDRDGEILWYKSILTDMGSGYNYNISVFETGNEDIVLGAGGSVLRLDGKGDVKWHKTVSAEFYGLVESEDGGLLFTGGDNENGDIWLGRLDYRGNVMWQKAIESGCLEVGSDLETCDDGGFITLSAGCDVSHLAKLGMDGEFYGACGIIKDAHFTLTASTVTLNSANVNALDLGFTLRNSSASIMDAPADLTFLCPEQE